MFARNQESKKASFDSAFIKNICPGEFDEFQYLPSVGASGGILIALKSSVFSGQLSFSNNFALSVQFTSKDENESWMLTSVYAPCTPNWLIVGDFNMLRKPEDRNREGADINEIFQFNEAINKLDIIELPLHGRQFTWTNKQFPPLLERLDWFFTSASWTVKYPDTIVKTLVMEVSDHWPCVIEISTQIPKANIF